MRLVVIVSDSAHLVHAGGEVERTAKSFDLPQEVADYIRAFQQQPYASVSVALEKEQP